MNNVLSVFLCIIDIFTTFEHDEICSSSLEHQHIIVILREYLIKQTTKNYNITVYYILQEVFSYIAKCECQPE